MSSHTLTCAGCDLFGQPMGDFRTLDVWHQAMDLVDDVYTIVRQFPKYELFGLSQQMRSAATSIPSLIAEGRGRYTAADQIHFYRQARGSAYELETQIEIAVRQHFMTGEDRDRLMLRAQKVGRMLNNLIKTTKPRSPEA